MVPFSSEETLFILLTVQAWRRQKTGLLYSFHVWPLGGSDEAATSCHISGTCGTTTPPCGNVGKLQLVRLSRTRVCVRVCANPELSAQKHSW